MSICLLPFFFFFNATAPTEIYPLSLHDALPISGPTAGWFTARSGARWLRVVGRDDPEPSSAGTRSEEHTSELQSHSDLVCRLLLEKKKKNKKKKNTP